MFYKAKRRITVKFILNYFIYIINFKLIDTYSLLKCKAKLIFSIFSMEKRYLDLVSTELSLIFKRKTCLFIWNCRNFIPFYFITLSFHLSLVSLLIHERNVTRHYSNTSMYFIVSWRKSELISKGDPKQHQEQN